jgi:transcriptional regulator with XRE-family HTH domain
MRIAHWTKLGAAVRHARATNGWSQQELAHRANVSRSWLAKVEAGHRAAELEPLLRLFAALRLTFILDDADAASEQSGGRASSSPDVPAGAAHDAATRRAAAAQRRRDAWASGDERQRADPTAHGRPMTAGEPP